MKLTKYSQNKFYKTLSDYEVPREYANTMFNYVIHGLPPGGFFTALLANDAMGAFSRSHPANTIPALKSLVSWILNIVPVQAYGSYDKVDAWIKMPADQRRTLVESCGLIYTEQQEIMMTLKGEKTIEPIFW